MGVILNAAPSRIAGSLRLPGSKSSSNRWLIIAALSGTDWKLTGLSTAEDTRVLQAALLPGQSIIQVGAAGTAMRFMTVYLASRPGEYQLHGKDRAHDRPIGILVDALLSLGASIEYLEKPGYPPLRIQGKKLKGGNLKIDASVSSQYLTALLLVATTMEDGLSLSWSGELSSKPYVAQTLAVLQEAGINWTWKENYIRVYPGQFSPVPVNIEPDWSSAAYWLAFACLLPTKLLLQGLLADSPQADRIALAYLSEFGLNYRFVPEGLELWRDAPVHLLPERQWDFTACPDLAPTLIVLCAALNQKATFTGLRSLRIKESDRLLALKTELSKFGARLTIGEDQAELHNGCTLPPTTIIAVNSWQDHRIVMSFSLLSAVGYSLYFDHPEVVSKSYPSFWEDLSKFGFQFHQQDVR